MDLVWRARMGGRGQEILLLHLVSQLHSFKLIGASRADSIVHFFVARPEVYHINTSNILFILSGSFVGLESIIKRRVAKGVCISSFLNKGVSTHTCPAVVVDRVYC